ncbi:MAG: hypothetical protein Ct9H300mP10_08760 [Methanobacteriota archaeon]|nr:MAG: hypothetical protein Ct9H300mP10_08760 [Euryarchaeota archaeon]
MREPIDNIGLSNTLRGAMASWSKSLSRELDPCITINNILPGFTDTDRLDSLASSISERTGSPVEDITEGWLSGVPSSDWSTPWRLLSRSPSCACPRAGRFAE